MYSKESVAGSGFQLVPSLRRKSQQSSSTDSDNYYVSDKYGNRRVTLSKCGLVCGRDTCDTRGFTCAQQYIVTSLVLLCIEVGLIGWDYYCIYVTQNTSHTSQQFAMGILVMHSVAFYQALLAFVYHTQKKYGRNRWTTFLTIISVVFNIVAFVVRLGFEIAYIGYRPERLHQD